jgi:drug/metabolite transporter (DMT)-like permease
MTRRGWLLFIAMAVFWGIPYFFIKIAVREIDPATVVFARVGIAALVLLPIALARGLVRSLRKQWKMVVLLALVQIVIPFLLISYGEQHISSSLTSLLIASEPLIIALLALRFDAAERVRGWRLLGLIVGLLGVVVLLGFDVSGDAQGVLGAGLVLLATISYAVAALLVKRAAASTGSGLGVIAVECSVATILLLPLALLNLPAHLPSSLVIISIVILGLICTALAFLAFYALIAEVGASRGIVFTYFNPVISVLLGVTLLAEPLNVSIIIGFVLIIIGSWLSTSSVPLLKKKLTL